MLYLHYLGGKEVYVLHAKPKLLTSADKLRKKQVYISYALNHQTVITKQLNACPTPSSIHLHDEKKAPPPRSPLLCHLRPNILLILPTTSHSLDDLLPLLSAQPPLLRDDLAQHHAHLSRHITRVAAHVEICFLLQQLVHERGLLFEAMLNVDFLRTLAGEGGEELKAGKGFGEGLGRAVSGFVSLDGEEY